MIGRVAGIIPGGEFKIGKREIYLSNNLDENHFHGGIDGFDKVVWDSYIQNGKVIMTYISKDREEGYPGPLFIQVTFQLTRRNQFIVEITANPAKPTPIAITPHIYFNLAGHGEGPDGLKEHCLMVNADRFVVTDFETNIPTGELQDVGGTYYDLRVPRPLEKILNNVPGGGYDHTFCLTKGGAKNNITFSAR
ncbi:hypothetical protein AAG570_006659 [Ranatra chinensis]|uniref:Galactose mutarotase n=1 Tax=Ranatra chinensis TaxID=642074 RepID=A0ABD0YUQ2_9HEMI